jgi:hypothetical protein
VPANICEQARTITQAAKARSVFIRRAYDKEA